MKARAAAWWLEGDAAGTLAAEGAAFVACFQLPIVYSPSTAAFDIFINCLTPSLFDCKGCLLGEVAERIPSGCSGMAIGSVLLGSKFETGDEDVVPVIAPLPLLRCCPLWTDRSFLRNFARRFWNHTYKWNDFNCYFSWKSELLVN